MFILLFLVLLGLGYFLVFVGIGAAGIAKGVGTTAKYATKKVTESRIEELRDRGVLISTFAEIDEQEKEFQRWLKEDEMKDKYEEFHEIKVVKAE